MDKNLATWESADTNLRNMWDLNRRKVIKEPLDLVCLFDSGRNSKNANYHCAIKIFAIIGPNEFLMAWRPHQTDNIPDH